MLPEVSNKVRLAGLCSYEQVILITEKD